MILDEYSFTPRQVALLMAFVEDNPYIPNTPTLKQAEFCVADDDEVFFGGAAGGGKSDGLLTAGLMYVILPKYSGIIIRESFAALSKPDALIDRSHAWLDNTDAHWDEKKYVWTFPTGSKLSFGYIQTERDLNQYDSTAYQFIGYDELTQMPKKHYTHLFSRLRKLKDSDIPLRVRSASNPGNIGHKWVKERFIEPWQKTLPNHRTFEVGYVPKTRFIPSKLDDNPYLDAESYEKALNELDALQRKRFRDGDWDISEEGNMFKREWFEKHMIDIVPRPIKRLRFWDLASTSDKDRKRRNSAETAGALLYVMNPRETTIQAVFMDICTTMKNPAGVEDYIRKTAEADGRNTVVYIEQEPGSAGVNTISHYRRNVLPEFTVIGHRSKDRKVDRASPASSKIEHGLLVFQRGDWNEKAIDHCCFFPSDAYPKDIVDTISGANEAAFGKRSARVVSMAQ